jgi:hypothetical protein
MANEEINPVPAHPASIPPGTLAHTTTDNLSVDPEHFEAAITASRLTIAQRIELHGEWREYAEEDGTGLTSRQLLRVSRMLRNRPAYEERFGTDLHLHPVPLTGDA